LRSPAQTVQPLLFTAVPATARYRLTVAGQVECLARRTNDPLHAVVGKRSEVRLARVQRRVPALTEQLRKKRNAPGQRAVEFGGSLEVMRVARRQDAAPARTAARRGHVRAIEPDSVGSQSIQMRRSNPAIAEGPNVRGTDIIRNDQDDIRARKSD